jgi:hypothetical protein
MPLSRSRASWAVIAKRKNGDKSLKIKKPTKAANETAFKPLKTNKTAK